MLHTYCFQNNMIKIIRDKTFKLKKASKVVQEDSPKFSSVGSTEKSLSENKFQHRFHTKSEVAHAKLQRILHEI